AREFETDLAEGMRQLAHKMSPRALPVADSGLGSFHAAGIKVTPVTDIHLGKSPRKIFTFLDPGQCARCRSWHVKLLCQCGDGP
ncbi:MAG TPA: hypothetical protein PK706_03160, partial [Xanthobacteraceae bacterium]|nr:hypothetical protein [Xanthobacteraceae bacterium]